MPICLGLAANKLHHQTEDAALFSLLRACEAGIRELKLGFHAVAAPMTPSPPPACCRAIGAWCATPMAAKAG